MHEVGIMSAALSQVSRIAASRKGTHVEKVVLTVGLLSGVEPDSLQFAFEALKVGSPAENAVLEIVRPSPAATCLSCNAPVTPDQWMVLRCRQCGELCANITKGRELELSQVVLAK